MMKLPAEVTVNVVVAVVLLSVIVSVHARLPVVRLSVAAVFELTDGTPSDSPEQPTPVTVNRVLGVSLLQRVFVPVSKMAGLAPVKPELGLTANVAAATATVPLLPSDPVIVSVPVPDPVVTTTVSRVPEVFVWLMTETPATPDGVKVVLPVQDVPLPVSVSEIWPE